MPTDFRDAAVRHFEDAEYLDVGDRMANADHLFGLSAECALKAVMQGLGMVLRPDGAPDQKQHRVHINRLWGEFITFSQLRSGAKYASCIDPMNNPFSDWDVSQRYCNRNDITSVMLTRHKKGSEQTKQVLDMAILDGVVQ
uniref:SAM-dependent methyltransferase n=1 Tax=Desulfatirhabdium butyrativorans TaxID=340467 RepID=A0A7C4RRM4_9BACT